MAFYFFDLLPEIGTSAISFVDDAAHILISSFWKRLKTYLRKTNMKETTIKELTEEEISQVHGGIAPVIGAIVTAIGHFGARTLVQSTAGRVSLGLFTYETAKHFGNK